MCLNFALQNVNAQCNCVLYGLSATIDATAVLPFCDELGVDVTLSNFETDECEADILLRISFGTYSESFDPMAGINYLGDLTLLSEDTWIEGGQRFFRRFSFLVNDIPPAESIQEKLRFSFTPAGTNPLDPVFIVHVEALPQNPECISTVYNPEEHIVDENTFEIAMNLLEPPITGTVTNLIVENRLLPNSSTNSQVERKTIHGLLEVDADYSFDGLGGSELNRPKLYLGPGAHILVKSGFTLTLTNADIFTCDQLAQGITLEPGASLIADGCVISDSRFAIDAQAGSAISIINTDFADNYIGVRLNMTDAPNRVIINAFENNNFFTDDGLKTPFDGMQEQVETRGYCGIWLNNYRDFNVFGDQNPNAADGNHFFSLANGIIGYNAIGNLGNLTFEDMNSADAPVKYLYEGFGIRLMSKGTSWFNLNEIWSVMTFDDCKTGIYAENYALNIENTVMDNVDIGIDVLKSKIRDIVIDGNTITARQYGIRSFLNEPLHPISAIKNNTVTITEGLTPQNNLTTGIGMEEIGLGFKPMPGQTLPVSSSMDGWEVSGNDVTMKEGGRGILYRNGFLGTVQANAILNESEPDDFTGIRTEGSAFIGITANTVDQMTAAGLGTATAIYSSGGFSNTVQCNCMDHTNVGMQFFDMADFQDAVRGNNLNTHCTGLQLGVDGVGGVYIGDQNHTGNLWDLNAISGSCLGGRNWGGGPQIIGFSEFQVNGTANASLDPDVFPGSDWFIDLNGTTFDGCGSCTFPPQIPPRVTEGEVPTKLDEAIARDSLDSGVFPNEMAWKGKFRLYRKILRQPDIESYATEYATFVSANDNLSSGKLAVIAEGKYDLFDLSAAEDSILESYRIAWREGMEALRILDSLTQAGASVNQGQYDDKVEYSADMHEQYQTYRDSLLNRRAQNISALLTLNSAVSASITPDINQRTVNGLALNLLLSDTLATGALASLESIAAQCPLEGGDAVYEARAIVSYFTGQDYSDAGICEDAQRQQRPGTSGKASSVSSFVVFPNPTKGKIHWNYTHDEPLTLHVFNTLGQLVMEANGVNGSANLEKLRGGLYALQFITSDGDVISTQKVQIVQH